MGTTKCEVVQTAASQIVAAALGVPSGSFSDAVMAKAKICLLDYLSCAFEALELPWSSQAAALASSVEGEVHMIGRRHASTLEDAAFANAVAGHGLVREDMHPFSVTHLGVVVWPTILALSEQHPISGRQALAAAIVGYETGGRIGRAIVTIDLMRLFRPTGLVGPFASVLSGARVMCLDEGQALNAFGLVGNCCAGLNEWPYTGASEMYFHPGFAVKNALGCLALARAGAVGSASILEGEAGFFQAYARTSVTSPISLFPNGDAEILSVFNKVVPACNFAQSPCQAALEAVKTCGAGSQRITAVRIDTTLGAVRYPGCLAKGPFQYALQAKMSIPFSVAATIVNGSIEEKNYVNLNDPEIARLISVTTLSSDGQYTAAYPGRQGARVTLLLEDGTSITAERRDVDAASDAMIHDRFRRAAGSVVGPQRAARIEEMVDGFDMEPVAGKLAAICAM